MHQFSARQLLLRSLGRLSLIAVICVSLSGCAISPLAHRTAVFAAAATATTKNTENAYDVVQQAYHDAQVARVVANFDDAGFDPSKLKPFLSPTDLAVRTQVLDGLTRYAELLAAVSGDQPLDDVDTGAKALGKSLNSISANDLVAGKLTATDANAAATAIDALGRALVDRKRRRELPGILHQMQQPIETICTLLEQDIGDPEHSGLRNQLHNSYLDLIRDQKNFIVDNKGKLTPDERRDEIRVLPQLATSESAADHALAKTQKALVQLARTHTALAVTSNQKYAPDFDLEIEQLRDTAQQLGGFYSSLASAK